MCFDDTHDVYMLFYGTAFCVLERCPCEANEALSTYSQTISPVFDFAVQQATQIMPFQLPHSHGPVTTPLASTLDIY